MKQIILLFFSLVSLIPVARAAETPDIMATYDVYAGGIHALQSTFTYTSKGGRYTTAIESQTYGLLGRLVPWHGIFKTSGWNLKDLRQPEQHVSDTVYKEDREINSYRYGKNGKFLSFSKMVNGKDEADKTIDPAIMQDTTDILSSTLEVMDRVAAGKGCDHSDKIFDSERSYDLMFKDQSKDVLKKNKYSIFSGEAFACTIEVKPGEGKWHKKPRGWLSIQEQGRKKGIMPTIWFAKMSADKNAPAIPVKILIKTDYGTFIIHLTSFKDKSAK